MKREPNFSSQWIARRKRNPADTGYGWELSIFLLVFVVVFSLQRLGYSQGADEGVEQWVNLTNQMFYGKQDFLFSYGPAYWITGGAASPYNAFSYWLAVLASSIVYATFWSSLFILAYRTGTYIFFAACYFLFFYSLIFPTAWYLWPLAVIAYLQFSKPKPITLGLRGLLILGVLTSLAFYVRYFYGVIAIIAYGTYFVSESLTHKRLFRITPYIIGVVLGYILFGLLIFHEWKNLFTYILINNQLNFGNSIDMTLDVDSPTKHLWAAIISVGAICFYFILRWRVLFLTTFGLSLIFLKMGFSRIDHCIGYFVVPMAVLSLLLLFDRRKFGRILFVPVIGCLYFMQTVPVFPGAPERSAFHPPIDLRASYADRMQRIYGGYKLDAALIDRIGSATIDVYPYTNEYIFANKLNYLRRPLFQNYMTLTPSLDAMNAHFFESSNRPRFVLWTTGVDCRSETCNVFDDFDQKWSLNEDPLTSSAILMNYHVVAISKGRGGLPVALMEENSAHTKYTTESISQESMKFGQWYKVPNSMDGVVKLVPRFKLTMRGRLENILFHGGILRVSYKLISGEVVSYRLNILNSASGVWASPLLSDFGLRGLKVDSILFETKSPGYFAPDFEGEWVTVPITGVHTKKPDFNPVIPLPNIKEKIDLTCDGAIDALNGTTPMPTKISDANVLIAQGWLAYSAKDGAPFDQILLTLTDDHGNTTFVATSAQDRPDVAHAFHQANLTSTGYRAVVDLSSLKGDYKLRLAGVHDAKLFTCRQFAPVIEVIGGSQ